MFERPDSGERAVLVHVYFPDGAGQEDLQEFTELVNSAGATAVATVTGTRAAPESQPSGALCILCFRLSSCSVLSTVLVAVLQLSELSFRYGFQVSVPDLGSETTGLSCSQSHI